MVVPSYLMIPHQMPNHSCFIQIDDTKFNDQVNNYFGGVMGT